MPCAQCLQPAKCEDMCQRHPAAREAQDAARYRKLRGWMSSNVPEGWQEVKNMGAVCSYMSWDDADAYLDSLPDCTVGLMSRPGDKPTHLCSGCDTYYYARDVPVACDNCSGVPSPVGVANPDAWRCLEHGECFGGKCIHAADGVPAPHVSCSGVPLTELQQLMKFYGVATTEALVKAQAHHVEKLQAKLPASPSLAPQRVRKG